MYKKPPILALLASLTLSGAAHAALLDRGGGLIYDTDLDVTWLQDTNYAKTSGYDVDGQMTWEEATTWAANLVFHDSVRNVDYSDWRMPFLPYDNDSICSSSAYSGGICGYNVDPTTGGEMAHLFFAELGNKSKYTSTGGLQADSGLVNTGSFINFQRSGYWFAGANMTFGPMAADIQPWLFEAWSGRQLVAKTSYVMFGHKYENYQYALAVRSGDVAAVPEADTWAMLLAGLGLIGAVTRRRRE